MRKNNEPTRVGIKSCYLPYQSSILPICSPKLGKVFEVLAPIGALRSFQKLRGAAQATKLKLRGHVKHKPRGQVFNLAVKRRRFRAARPLQATTSLLRLAVQDLRARILADLRFRKRLVSPLAAGAACQTCLSCLTVAMSTGNRNGIGKQVSRVRQV